MLPFDLQIFSLIAIINAVTYGLLGKSFTAGYLMLFAGMGFSYGINSLKHGFSGFGLFFLALGAGGVWALWRMHINK
jgi:hypothetical protein